MNSCAASGISSRRKGRYTMVTARREHGSATAATKSRWPARRAVVPAMRRVPIVSWLLIASSSLSCSAPAKGPASAPAVAPSASPKGAADAAFEQMAGELYEAYFAGLPVGFGGTLGV